MSSFNINLPSFVYDNTLSSKLSYSEYKIKLIILQNGIILLIVIHRHRQMCKIITYLV